MYYKISDFEKDWSYEKNATLKILNNLTDQSLNQKVSEDGRTLGRIAWHLVITIGEMLQKTGLSLYAVDENSDVPAKAETISTEYEKSAVGLTESLKKNWNDDSLKEEVSMYGEKWKKGVVLSSLIRHQIHHRGQMTVLMRQAGLKVPGVYGPAKEEWAQMGMQPMS